MIKTILSILAVGCLIAGLGLVANEGLKRAERVECLQWQKDSKTFVGWYSTGWQKEQCLTFGIELK